MTTVLSFRASGLAGRPDPVTYYLHPETNVFFGQNGTGKTSLLKLIASALKDDINLIRRVPFEQASVSFLDEAGIEVTRTIAAWEVQSTAQVQSLQVPAFQVQSLGAPFGWVQPTMPQRGWRSDPAQDQWHPVPCTYLSTSRIISDQFITASTEAPYSEARLDQIFAFQVLQSWTRYSNEVLSEIRQRQQAGLVAIILSLFSPDESNKTPTAVDVDRAYTNTAHFFAREGINLPLDRKQFQKLYGRQPTLGSVVATSEEVEQQIASAERPRRNLETLIRKFISTNKTVKFQENGISVELSSGGEIPIDLLSSGEKQLLRILVEVLGCGATPMLIDEPELSMHIDWQHELLTSMHTVNPEAQVIAATHSPEIMAEIPNERVFML